MKRTLFFIIISMPALSAMEEPPNWKQKPSASTAKITPEFEEILQEALKEREMVESEEQLTVKIHASVPTITLVNADGTRFFKVPKEIALQAGQIRDLLASQGSVEAKEQSFSFNIIGTDALRDIADIMRALYKRLDLNGKQLLDAVSNDIHLTAQVLFLLQTCDFLDFPLGIKIITAYATKHQNILDQINNLIRRKEIFHHTGVEIARTYYLITRMDLPGIDPKEITFSINDYLEYDPIIVQSRRRLDHFGRNGLDLSNLRLVNMDGFLSLPNLAQLHVLNLSNNQFTRLPANIFTNLVNLINLNLDHNQLMQLPDTIFANLANLEWLYINNSQLTQLPANIFANLANLIWLELDHNQFTQLPDTIFTNLANLRLLNISYNQLTQLPDTIFANLVNLSNLSLNDNRMTQLPADIFANLANLESLALHYNSLTQLPANIFANLTRLDVLYLSNNQLAQLPDTIFAHLTNLRALGLGSDQITQLPANIFANLANLRTLFLINNRLTERNKKELRKALPNATIFW